MDVWGDRGAGLGRGRRRGMRWADGLSGNGDAGLWGLRDRHQLPCIPIRVRGSMTT